MFGEGDGLSNRSIIAVAQQSDGHLWAATQNGLFRYDGSEFRKFGRLEGLNDLQLFNLFVDQTSTVWISTQSGLFYINPAERDPHFRELKLNGVSLFLPVGSHFAEGPAHQLLVSDQHGNLVAITAASNPSERIASLFHDRYPAFPTTIRVRGILLDRENTLWFACGRSICSFNAEEARSGSGWRSLQGVPGDSYENLLQDRTGTIWARSLTHLISWSPATRRVRDMTRPLPASAFLTHKLAMAEDPRGNLLITTSNGFATWDRRRWHETNATTQGPITGATDLLFDHEGALWIGTAGNGILQALGYGVWQNIDTNHGLPSPIVFALQRDRIGRLWIGHKLGISVMEPTPPGEPAVLHPVLKGNPKAVWIENMAPASDGGIWAESFDGDLWHFNPKGRADIATVIPGGSQRLQLAADGTLWSAGSGGLFSVNCHHGNPCRPAELPNQHLRGQSFQDMFFDVQGDMWLAGESGLWRVRFIAGHSSATRIAVPGVPNSFLIGCMGADRTLWLSGKFPGVVHVKVTGESAQLLSSPASNEVVNDSVQFLQVDSSGRLWIGTDHGVRVLQDESLVQITDQDGLIWNDTDWKAFFSASDGTVWIGTSGGVSHLLDPATVLQRNRFHAAFEEVRYNGKRILPGDSIAWNGGMLETRFSALTFRDNRTMLFHYTLDGLDGKPVDTTYPFVRFQNLPPGSYTLRITAEDTAHHVMSAPASFSFYLSPPWWRTGWFDFLLVLAAGLLAALAWRWSNLALLAQRTRLQRLVEERTTELYRLAVTDPLTGLPNRGSIMTSLTKESEAARKASAPLCVAIIDLDHFKQINDTYGHQAGDEVLREAAQRLSAGIRATDFVGRYGGEEFLIVFHNAQREFGLERCEAIRQSLCAQPVLIGLQSIDVTASIGFAWTEDQSQFEDALIALADRALYKAKANGRNRVEVAVPGGEVAS
jgi:diguanylate cyclase (GGDEF)-like protein